MTIAVSCPSCEKDLKLKDELAGKKVKCPACSGTVLVPAGDEEDAPEERTQSRAAARKSSRRADDEEDEAPRKKSRSRADEDEDDDEAPRKKKKSFKKKGKEGAGVGLFIGLGIGGLLLIGGVVGGIIWFMNRDGGLGLDLGNNARVTDDSYHKLKPGMSTEEVEAILGKGSSSSQDEAEKWLGEVDAKSTGSFRNSVSESGAKTWVRFTNGDTKIFVGYGTTKYGDRVATAFYAAKLPNGGYHTEQGVIAMGGVARLVEQQEKDKKILNDPKWFTGQQVRTALVGTWGPFGTGYEFQAPNTVKTFGQTGTYTFLDDRRIETEMPVLGDPNKKVKTVYHVRVDKNTLYLGQVYNDEILLIGPYQKTK